MTGVTEPVDIDAINLAIKRMRDNANDPDIAVLIGEYDRMTSKLAEVTNGQTTLILSEGDRAKKVCDLDDATLAQWTRWVFCNIDKVYAKKVAEDADKGVKTTMTMHAIISLAIMAFDARLETGMDTCEFTTRGVTYRDKSLGDWTVTIAEASPE